MKIKELREKTRKELKELLLTRRAEAASFKFQSARGRSKNVKELKELKKAIARILTLLGEEKV